MQPQHERVLERIEQADIRFVRLWFTDVIGTLKSVAISPAELEGAFAEGIGFDGSSIEGLTRVVEADMLVRPDPNTFQIMPWSTASDPVYGPIVGTDAARMFADLLTPEGQPAMSDPRYVLKRTVQHATDMGFTCYMHPEIEFYLLETPEPGKPLVPVDQAGYFDHVPRGLGHGFRRAAVATLENMGIPVEYSHHENGPGQSEIDLRFADPLTTADNIMTFRTIVKEIAIDHGIYATFMPKPMAEHPGSAMHTHISLFEGDRNLFHDAAGQYRLSITARHFIAGVLRYARETALITNQFVNSYKRLYGGQEAPAYVCWGSHNTSALVRVPMYKPVKGRSTRIEHRGLDAACNPYLAYAVILASGLKGIEDGLMLPDGVEEDVSAMSDGERAVMGIQELPTSLDQAISCMEESELVAATLGEHVFDAVLRNKREEWRQYRSQVTPFELNRYLHML